MDADTTRGLQAAARDAVGLSAARAAGGGAPPGGVSDVSATWLVRGWHRRGYGI